MDSSDFAIGQFRFLWFLLFKHGRWNYRRFAVMLNYYFYKNFAYTFMQILHAIQNGFSMTSVYPDAFLTLFNLLFTSLPIQWYAVSEVDVHASDFRDGAAYRAFVPSLYFPGQRNLQYNPSVTRLWLSTGLIQALALYAVPFYGLHGKIISPHGTVCEDQIMGLAMFTSLLFVVTNKLIINHQHIDVVALAAYFCSAGLGYVLYLYVVDDYPALSAHHFTFKHCWTSAPFYAATLASSAICLVLDLLLLSTSKLLYTDTRDVIREHALLKGAEEIGEELHGEW